MVDFTSLLIVCGTLVKSHQSLFGAALNPSKNNHVPHIVPPQGTASIRVASYGYDVDEKDPWNSNILSVVTP